MMRKVGVFVALLVASFAVVAGVLAQTGVVSTDEPQVTSSTRTYEIPGQFAFDYPLDAYSVDTSGCTVASAGMQGAIEVKPNDSYIYGDNRNTYSVKIAAITNSEVYDASDLSDLLGTLPLLQYDPSLLVDRELQTLEINGHPAVRVDNVQAGLSGVTTHMIILGDGQLLEVVVEPYSFAAETPDEETENASRSVAQGIIDSIRWETAS